MLDTNIYYKCHSVAFPRQLSSLGWCTCLHCRCLQVASVAISRQIFVTLASASKQHQPFAVRFRRLTNPSTANEMTATQIHPGIINAYNCCDRFEAWAIMQIEKHHTQTFDPARISRSLYQTTTLGTIIHHTLTTSTPYLATGCASKSMSVDQQCTLSY